MRRRPALALFVLVAAVGCASRAGVEPGPWRAPLGRAHPLTGRVWDVRAGRFTGSDALVPRLAAARYVLLGEKHDNPDHHAIQAALLRAVLATGRRPAVVFEQLTADQAPALARHLAAAPRDAAGLGEALDWKHSGWPDWTFYRPIARAALDAGVPLVAGNLAPATTRALARGEPGALPADLAARYALDRPLAPAIHARLAAELREAHCGHLPPAHVESMVLAQRARDATLADAMLGAGAGGAVLIAGVGHVRDDRGVPLYLRARAPDTSIVVVAPLEVREEWTRPEQYGAAFDGALPFDWVWFTPRVDDADPCRAFSRGKP
jgi:uncharacterized iron-regulated protein